MSISHSFWNNRQVLVTGHTGFKGSWLSLWLSNLGADVSGIALNPPTSPNLFDLARIQDSMSHNKILDIRNRMDVHDAVSEIAPEIIFHLAAQPLVRQSYSDPVETYETNIMGLVHLFEAIRHTPSVKTVIIVTTDKCYDNREWVWGYRESDALGGRDPYSSSKGCAEIVAHAYRSSFLANNGVAVATARAGNVIGGGDWAQDRLIPDILSSIAKGIPPLIRYPDAIRPWQHVLDPLNGYLALAEQLSNNNSLCGAWNFGPDNADCLTVAEVTETLLELYGTDITWTSDQEDTHHEARFLKLDCAKASSLLKWRPQWSCKQTLSAVVDWHKKYLAGNHPEELCMDQIHRFSQQPAKGLQI